MQKKEFEVWHKWCEYFNINEECGITHEKCNYYACPNVLVREAKSKEEIRKIIERRMAETSFGGKRDSLERFHELAELRMELLGDKLTSEGKWVNSKEEI